MSDHESKVGEALEHWRVVGAQRDWGDVLCRASEDERPRRPIAKPLLVVAAIFTAVLVAAPASGLLSTVVRLFERDRGIQLVAALTGPQDEATFEILAPGAFVATVDDQVIPRFRSREDGRIRFRRIGTLQWRLRDVEAVVREVRIRYPSTALPRTTTLCAPCDRNPSGSFMVTADEALMVFNGRASVVVRTTQGTRHGGLSLQPVRR